MKYYHKAIYKLSKAPDHPKSGYYIATCHIRLKEYEKGLAALEAAEKTIKRKRAGLGEEEALDKSFFLLYAEIYEKMGKKEQAVKTLRDLYARMPDDDTVANFLGYVLADHGESLDEAEKLIALALEKRPDSAAYLDSMSWVLYRKKDFQMAESFIIKAIESSKDEPDAVILDHAGDIYMPCHRRARLYPSGKRLSPVRAKSWTGGRSSRKSDQSSHFTNPTPTRLKPDLANFQTV